MSPEEAFAKAFIQPARRSRFLTLLESRKGRLRLRETFAHFKHLDSRYTKRIPPNQQTPEGIAHLLRSKGAPANCHVMSESPDLDGREMDLLTTLRKTLGYGYGTFLLCCPGKLAFYESEEPKERYILERSS